MVIIKKPNDPSTVKGGVKSIFGALREESIEQLKEVKKDISRSFGSEPVSGEKPKSWEDEWLKDKDKNNPPISEKEGGHSQIDPAKMMEKSTEKDLAAVRNRLNQQFTRASSTSEYGKEQAQKYQQEHTPIYDKIKQEEEQKRKQQQQAAAQQQGPVGPPKGKPKGGLGKKKHKASPMELNRAEFRGAKGK